MNLEEALHAYVAATFGGLGILFLIGFVVVVGIALTYAVIRR